MVTERRTAVDGATVVQRLLTEDDADSETVMLVYDQWHRHKLASLDQAFPPATARLLVER